MSPERDQAGVLRTRIAERGTLFLLTAVATSLLYAEGVLKNGWIEVALLTPVLWFLLAPRVPPVLPNLLVSLLTICVTVSALDLALRPLIGQRLHYTPTNMFPRKLPALPTVGRWDPEVSYRGEAYGDLAAIAGDSRLREPRVIHFETDAAGFRNRDSRGPFDVLVLGDSFSAGVGTTQERTFPGLLQSAGRRVYNLSYPGGPYDQYVNFAIEWPRLAVASDAWLIWTLYTGNDLDDGYGAVWDPRQLPIRSGWSAWTVQFRTFRNRSPINQILEGLRVKWGGAAGDVLVRRLPDGRPMLFVRAHEAWGTRHQAEVEQHPNFPRLAETLAAMRRLAEARHLRMAVLILPTKGEIYRWVLDGRQPWQGDDRAPGFGEAVLAVCRREGIICLDTRQDLVAAARHVYEANGGLLWWRDDTHLGESGHQAVADLIVRKVLGGKAGIAGIQPVRGLSR